MRCTTYVKSVKYITGTKEALPRCVIGILAHSRPPVTNVSPASCCISLEREGAGGRESECVWVWVRDRE